MSKKLTEDEKLLLFKTRNEDKNSPYYRVLHPFFYDTSFTTAPDFKAAKDFFDGHERMHWMSSQVNTWSPDKIQYEGKLTELGYREFIEAIMTLFTQMDLDVGGNYLVLVRMIKDPWIRIALISALNRESVHVDAYSKMIAELGLEKAAEHFFEKFKEQEEMKKKHDFLSSVETRDFTIKDSPELLRKKQQAFLLNLAIFGAFTEGLQLYGNFALLLAPWCQDKDLRKKKRPEERVALMESVRTVVAWSANDEITHVAFITSLFHRISRDLPELVTPKLKQDITKACRQVVKNEIDWGKKLFSKLPKGMTRFCGVSQRDLSNFIKYLADLRLMEFNCQPVFGKIDPTKALDDIENIPTNPKVNPIHWFFSEIADASAAFFEVKATSYSLDAMKGNLLSKDARAELEMEQKTTLDKYFKYINTLN